MNKEKPNFDNLFESAAAEFLAAFKRSRDAVRPDEIGEVREQQLREFLKEWLPHSCGVTHGYLINTRREISRQIDAILYNSVSCPKFLLNKNTDLRLVPADDTYGTIEVKSTLTPNDFSDALEKAQSVYEAAKEDQMGDWDLDLHVETKIVRLVEEDNGEEQWKRQLMGFRQKYLDRPDWQYYWAEIGERAPRRTKPFTVLFAYHLDSSLDLHSLKQKLQQKENGPTLVVILSKGLVVKATQSTLDRIRGLQEQRPSASYRFDFSPNPEFEKMFQEASTLPHVKSHYFVIEFKDESTPLLFFYAFLMDYLAEQRLAQYMPSDLLAVWRKKESSSKNESHP